MIDVAVSNALMLIDDRIISFLQSCAAKSPPRPIEAAVSTAIVTAINEQVAEKMISEAVKYAVSEAMTSQEVMLMVALKLISFG